MVHKILRDRHLVPTPRGCARLFFLGLLVLATGVVALWFHFRDVIKHGNEMGKAHEIELLLYAYASDHDGKYPSGKTSTEVSQKLIDENYVTDPSVFYFPMPGKVRPTSFRLKPENVCWDATCCVDKDAPYDLPLIYTTGYKVFYQTGTKVMSPAWPPRTWRGWLTPDDYPRGYMIVFYLSIGGNFLKTDPDGTIPHFISDKFDAKGKTYHQLTPDGSLP
jgi:hypothetical protein